MKKVLFLIVTLVCAVTGAWADNTSVVSGDEGKTLTITTTEANTLSSNSVLSGFSNDTKAAFTKIVLDGAFSSSDLDVIKKDNGYSGVKVIDMSQAEFPKQAGGNTSYIVYANLPETSEGIHSNIVVGGTVYKSVGDSSPYTWGVQSSYEDGQTVSNHFERIEDAPAPDSNNNSYIVVGGALYKPVHSYNPEKHTWEYFTDDGNDWTQMTFNYWNSLEEIFLPTGFTADNAGNNFYSDNRNTLKTIHYGEAYATIGTDGNNKTALIHADDATFEKLKAIVKLDNFVSQDKDIVQEDTSGDCITYDKTTKIATVQVTKAGSLKKLFKSDEYPDGTIFRFDSNCTGFTAEDLQVLAPQNGPYYYVDLYDVTVDNDIETAIETAVKTLDSSNRHYKGLLLPKNVQKIGTTLIVKDGDNVKSPVTEFIAYNSGNTTTMHIYNESIAAADTYVNNLGKAKTMMDAHEAIKTNTTVYLVSTNSADAISGVESIKGNAKASIVHTYNNEMVNANASTKPIIEVIPAATGDFATLNSATNIRNTPNTKELRFCGNISEADILAVNHFTQATWNEGNKQYFEATSKDNKSPTKSGLSEIPSGINNELL